MRQTMPDVYKMLEHPKEKGYQNKEKNNQNEKVKK